MEGKVMDAIIWLVIIICGLGVGITYFGGDVRQFIYKDERVKKATGNSQDNVRIQNRSQGTTSKPIEIEPLSNDRFKIVMEDVHPPFARNTIVLNRSQLKHDPIKTIHTGRVYYWITEPDLVVKSMDQPQPVQQEVITSPVFEGVLEKDTTHPTLTKEEIYMKMEAAEIELQRKEGELRNIKANMRKEIEDAVANVSTLSMSKNQNYGR
jgi:hypothetical protein